jgi:hypothetical protein
MKYFIGRKKSYTSMQKKNMSGTKGRGGFKHLTAPWKNDLTLHNNREIQPIKQMQNYV